MSKEHQTILVAITLYKSFSSTCSLFATESAAKAKVGDRAADYFQELERNIELVRCQEDVLATIEVADYLQACDSVMLVVQTTGKHEISQAETEALFISFVV